MIRYLLPLLLLLSSCELTRKISKSKNDTAEVSKSDSGNVRKNETTTKTDAEWWREIATFQPGKDSFYIEKTTKPVNNYYTQPIQIIREGGTVQVQTTQINYDSLWNNKLDSLVSKLTTVEKDTNWQVFSFWQLLGIAALGGVVLFILQKTPLRLSVNKKA